MKNLKRILSLFAVLALCLGSSVMAYAASYDAYPDADEVTYEEQMDVLASLGIIQGSDGQLNPKANVSREEAAKIIAYFCLGPQMAESLTGASTGFEDVASSRWSSGYIAYCASRGIINGVGDTNGNGVPEFNPTGNVTGYEFAKMLLCAIGYGANGEFAGSNWAINTAVYSQNTGLFDGSGATSYNDPATREEVVLYAFNILTGTMTVSYSSSFELYYSGSSPLNEVDEDDEYKYTLGYQVYGLYQKDTDEDAFGRQYYEWDSDDGTVSDQYFTGAELAYTTEVSSADLYTALGKDYAGEAAWFVDGERQDDFTIAKGYTAKSVGGNGTLTLVYTDDYTEGYDVTIICVNTYLGQVVSVGDEESRITVYHDDGTLGTYDYETTQFDEDDFVLVTIADDEIQSAELAESFSGVMNATSDSYVTIDGVTYYKNATYGAFDEVEDDKDYSSIYTFYVDSYGYLMGGELYEAAETTAYNYVYVYDSEFKDDLGGATARVAVQHLDGSREILTLKLSESDGKYTYSLAGTTKTAKAKENSGELSGLTYGFYRFSLDSNGYATLKTLSTTSQPAAGWGNKTVEIPTSTKVLKIAGKEQTEKIGHMVYVNSSTVLHVIDSNDNVTIVTGYDNIKGYVEGRGVNLLVFYDGAIVEDIYVFGGTYTDSSIYAFYTGTKYSTDDGDFYYFYQDGATVAYELDDGVEVSGGCLYTIETSSGVITKANSVKTYPGEEVTSAKSAYFTTEDGTRHYYDDDVVVYDAENGNVPAAISVGDYVVYAEKDGMVVCAYIVPAPSTNPDDDTPTVEPGDITNLKLSSSSVSFNADKTGTYYVVVEKFTDGQGYTTFFAGSVKVQNIDNAATLEYDFGIASYRVSVYADADHSTLLASEYKTVVETVK